MSKTLLLTMCLIISGCAIDGITQQSVRGAAIAVASNDAVDEGLGFAAATAAIQFVKPNDKAGTATDVLTITAGLNTLNNGKPFTADQLTAASVSLKSNKSTANYTQMAQLIANPLAVQISKWEAQGATGAQIQASVSAFLTGAQLAATIFGGSA